jgi:hypothetical protein
LRELQKLAPDHKTLRAQVLHILLASRDTVACLLSNLVFALSKEPAVYSRLRQEVLDCTGSDRPNIEQLHSMKYLKWCVNECKNQKSSRGELLPVLTDCSFALTSRHTDKCPRSGCGHDLALRRWPRRQLAALHQEGHACNVQRICNASKPRCVWSRCGQVCSRAMGGASTRVGLLAIQRWTTRLYWP